MYELGLSNPNLSKSCISKNVFIGSPGSANNELFNPRGIAIDSSSNTLYIADYYNHRVMKYLSGATSGTVVAGGNGQGSATNQLNYPIGLYFDSSSNSLLIANSVGHNIVRWVVGANSWTLVAGSISGTSGSTSTLLNQPQDVVLDSMGNLYVADGYNNRVQFFLAGQSSGVTIAGTGTPSSTATGLYLPTSVAVDAQFNVYVSDYQNLRVQKFQPN
jgi:sugar lactone lactonase YvrE